MEWPQSGYSGTQSGSMYRMYVHVLPREIDSMELDFSWICIARKLSWYEVEIGRPEYMWKSSMPRAPGLNIHCVMCVAHTTTIRFHVSYLKRWLRWSTSIHSSCSYSELPKKFSVCHSHWFWAKLEIASPFEFIDFEFSLIFTSTYDLKYYWIITSKSKKDWKIRNDE